jgi:hypothetical protein
MFRPAADWIATTQLSLLLRKELWIVPASQSVHILSIGVVFSSTMLINLRLLGVGAGGRRISQLCEQLLPWVWRALIALLFTGAIQTIAEPVRQFVTPAFWAKMLMVVLVVALTEMVSIAVRRDAPRWDNGATRPLVGKVFAVVSALLWMAIITCGRLIGYTWINYA